MLKAASHKVAQACSTAHRAMRGEGLQVLEMISADCDSQSKAQGCKDKWGNILLVHARLVQGAGVRSRHVLCLLCVPQPHTCGAHNPLRARAALFRASEDMHWP